MIYLVYLLWNQTKIVLIIIIFKIQLIEIKRLFQLKTLISSVRSFIVSIMKLNGLKVVKIEVLEMIQGHRKDDTVSQAINLSKYFNYSKPQISLCRLERFSWFKSSFVSICKSSICLRRKFYFCFFIIVFNRLLWIFFCLTF